MRLNHTKDTVEQILISFGLRRNSGSYIDYERAKRLLFGGRWYEDYDQIIDWIGDYLNV